MKALTLLMLFLSLEVGNAQDIWNRMNDTPVPMLGRKGAVSFSINGLGYVGTGSTSAGVYLKDFWEYNPSTDTWRQLKDVGGVPRYLAIGFSIGSKGYIGTGNIANNQSLVGSNDFYEYDPTTDQWVNRQSVGLTGRISAVGFSIGGKGYVTTGFNGNNFANYDNSTWEFDPTLNGGFGDWIAKADFPGGSRAGAAPFVVNGKSYVVAGEYVNPNNIPQVLNYMDTWEFNPFAGSTGNWVQKAFLPTPFTSLSGFSIGSKGYILGDPFNPSYSKLWAYNPASDAWSQGANYPPLPSYPTTFQICNQAFVTGNSFSRQVWKFTEALSVVGPTLVCSSATYSISNLLSGTSISWSSSNPNGLSINPTSGLATRVNNFNGQVTITATIIGGMCNSQSTLTVYVGVPATPGQLLQPISPMCVNQTKQATIAVVPGATSFTWWSNDPNLDVGNSDYWTSNLVTAYAAGTRYFTIKSKNSCGPSSTRQYGVGITTCSGGGGNNLVAVSPNPAFSTLTVEVILSSQTAEEGSSRTIDGLWLRNDQGNVVMLSNETNTRIALQIGSLAKGVYYLTIKVGEETEIKRIVIDR